MSYELMILLSALGLTALSVYLFTYTILKQESEAKALSWAEGDEPVKSDFPLIQFSRPLVHNFTLSHVKKIKRQNYRDAVEKKIVTAGLTKELNVDEFLGLQILWGIGFPILFVVLNFALQFGFPYWFVFIMIGLGMYFPHAYCNSAKQKRQGNIMSELPLFVDILALSIEAGLDFIGAIQKITEKAPKDSILAQELFIVLKDLRLGQTRKKALTALDERIGMPEMKSIVTVIRDATETGASVGVALKAKSAQIRFERFAKAEEVGAKMSQKILIPMMLFIIPAVFIIVLAPAGLQFLGGN